MSSQRPESISPQTSIAINGTRIKQLRESKGLTQLYVSTVLRVTVDTVSRWENNRSPKMKLENAEKLAAAFEVSIEEISKPQPKIACEKISEEPAPPDSIQGKKGIQWLPTALLILLVLVLLGVGLFHLATPQQPEGEMRAVRYLPNHASPTQSFPVIIKVTSSFLKSISFIMKEVPPPSCTVSKGEPAFVVQSGDQAVIKWLSSTDEEDELYFAYLAHVDQFVKQGRELTFSGQLMLDGKTQHLQEIIGGDKVTIMNYHWADSNKDHIIDDSEILSIYNSFDLLQDLGIDIEEIRNFWANKGYRWNSHDGKFETVP